MVWILDHNGNPITDGAEPIDDGIIGFRADAGLVYRATGGGRANVIYAKPQRMTFLATAPTQVIYARLI